MPKDDSMSIVVVSDNDSNDNEKPICIATTSRKEDDKKLNTVEPEYLAKHGWTLSSIKENNGNCLFKI